ncbi:MAG: sulfotransferase family 2 domain-containing protein [Flavobacteriales bacterium]
MISHKHRTIFVHIPKCAGTSVEVMFLHDLGLTYANRAPLVLRKNEISDLGPPRLAHLRASDYVRHHYISQSLFESYYKFAITRHPFDRLRSTYVYLGFNRWMSFSVFINRVVKQSLEKRDYLFWFLRPQVHFIFDEEMNLIVDDVFEIRKINFLAESLIDKEILNAPNGVPKVNVGNERGFVSKRIQDVRLLRRHWKSVLLGLGSRTQRSPHLSIREMYSDDFKYLGYD